MQSMVRAMHQAEHGESANEVRHALRPRATKVHRDVGDDSNRRFNPFSSNRRIRPNGNALAQTNTTHLPKRNTC